MIGHDRVYRGGLTRIDLSTLDRLCRHFGVTTCEILEYVPDGQATPGAGR